MISRGLAEKLKPCECGCGTLIEPRDKKNRTRRFLPGHSSRINHGMRNKKAVNNKGGPITKQGYRLIYIPLSKRKFYTCKKDGYAFEHRYVTEEHIGRKLLFGEVIHHINGNKLDNRIENLKLMTINSHAKHESVHRPVNWEAIKAMKLVNTSKKKKVCIVTDCNNLSISNGLCNKHDHLKRRGLLFIKNGVIEIMKHVRKKQESKEKTCIQCGKKYLTNINGTKYCYECRTPCEHVKRYRKRLRGEKNVIS